MLPNHDSEPSDSVLVERARRGDAAAFETLVRRHFRVAYTVAMSVLANSMDAEDVCQDAFVKALERLDDCRQPERFVGWLLQIVRNHAKNFREYRRVRDTEPLEHDTAAAASATSHDSERDDLRAVLEEALSHLDERQRSIVLLHDLEGWEHKEIANELGISEVMSRQVLFVARRLLRERLGPSALREYINE